MKTTKLVFKINPAYSGYSLTTEFINRDVAILLFDHCTDSEGNIVKGSAFAAGIENSHSVKLQFNPKEKLSVAYYYFNLVEF